MRGKEEGETKGGWIREGENVADRSHFDRMVMTIVFHVRRDRPEPSGKSRNAAELLLQLQCLSILFTYFVKI